MLLRILKLLLKLRGSFKKFHKQFYNEMEGKIGLLLIFSTYLFNVIVTCINLMFTLSLPYVSKLENLT